MNKSGNFIRPRPRSAPTPDGRHPCIPFSCRRNVDNLSVPRNGTGNSTTVPQRRGGRGRCERVSRPFRAGGNGRMPDPGRRCALPWAGISRPFRPARANLSVPRNAYYLSVPRNAYFRPARANLSVPRNAYLVPRNVSVPKERWECVCPQGTLSVPRNVSVPKERLFICLSPGTLI